MYINESRDTILTEQSFSFVESLVSCINNLNKKISRSIKDEIIYWNKVKFKQKVFKEINCNSHDKCDNSNVKHKLDQQKWLQKHRMA